MKSLEHYKKTFMWMAERGLADYRQGSEEKMDLFRQATARRTGKAQRMLAAFKLIKEFLPSNERTEKAIDGYFKDTSRLPFNTETLEYKGHIGGGAACDVLLLESTADGSPSYVVKVQRRINPKVQGETVEATAANLKHEYERIRQIYADIPEIIPKEFTMVMESPFKADAGPAVALVQRYYGRHIRDLFSEISREELAGICEREPELKQTLDKFIDITKQHFDDDGEILDFFGPKNLSVVEEAGRHQLVLLDPHVTYSKSDQAEWQELKAEARLDYLYQLKESLA